MPPHHPGKRLRPDGAVSAPKGSLRSGSAFFAGLLQPFCLYQEVLGVVVANIKFLAFVSKIHHPEGSVSAFSDASVFRIVSSVHDVRQSFPILSSLLGSLHGSAGLHAGHGSGSEFSPQSWIRLRPYLHDWLFRRPPESRFSFSEDVPLIMQLSRNSRRLGDVSACGASVVISSSESYWTLLVSGLLQPGNESTSFSQLASCFYHEWIYPHS